MGKHILKFELDYDFELIGISTHLKIHKLAWLLNKELNLNFTRLENHSLRKKGLESDSEFAKFQFDDQINRSVYTLLENKGINGLLVPELKNIDFFMLISGLAALNMTDNFNIEIQQLEGISSSMKLNIENLKSKNNLFIET